MTDDTKNRRGTGKPGAGKGGKDLDELKAKLGLKKPAAKGVAEKPKSAAEDFKFSFGEKPTAEPALSQAELAAIDAEVQKAAKPMGRKIVLLVVAVVVSALLLWLGYQFGNSMGLRVLHNEAVNQAVGITDFFSKGLTDKSGRQLSSRQDATGSFSDALDTYLEERYGKFNALLQVFGAGDLPKDFDFEAFKKEELAPLKIMCKDFLTNVEGYNLGAILQGQLYSTELGAKLLEFTTKANMMRGKVEALYVSIELLETYQFPAEPPGNLKPKLLLLANKGEKEKDKVIGATSVEVAGTPEVDRELSTKELCEPISMELEIPICDAKKGEPEFEKRLIDTFEKREQQEVKPYRKIKIKTEGEGKGLVAKIEHLFELDLRPYLKPLLAHINGDRKSGVQNFGVLFASFFQNLNDVREAGEGVDYTSVLEVLEKYASQETFFTL